MEIDSEQSRLDSEGQFAEITHPNINTLENNEQAEIPARTENSPMTPTFAGYRVIEELSSNHAGRAFKVESIENGSNLLLKLVDIDLSANSAIQKDLFDHEIKSLMAIEQDNLIPILDLGYTANGQPYVVCELTQCSNLAELLERKRFLPAAFMLEVLLEVSHGLLFLHENSLVHKGLRPENILIDFSGAKYSSDEIESVKLTDLGISSFSPKERIAAYISPEQRRNEFVDLRSDIYSFGCIIFEMLEGRALAFDSSPPKMSGKKYEKDPIKNGLRVIALRCLEPEPEKRYQSMIDVIKNLESLEFSEKIPGMTSGVDFSDRNGKKGENQALSPLAKRLIILFTVISLTILIVLAITQ